MKHLLFILFAIGLAGCQSNKVSGDHLVELSGEAQGTTFSIRYTDSAQRDFSKPLDSLFTAVNKSMSTWDTTSTISKINRDAVHVLDPMFEQVFRKSMEVSEATDGAFDVSVGPLVGAWGFGFKKGETTMPPRKVDSLRALIGYKDLKLSGNQAVVKRKGMQIDFNAIAQGYTVDLVGQFLESKGIEHYMVELGGEVFTKGKKPDGTLWRIGIDKPTDQETEGRPLQAIVNLSNKALSTSGSYRKFYIRNGVKYSHTIDPKTGYPVKHNLLSVSVIANDCATSDAYATAFMVMGVEKTLSFIKGKPLEVFMIFGDEKGGLQVKMSEGFKKYLAE
ncbi:MAG: FAD:protein FMN transferase [Bacteroidetes Order II. Incertae sedis bacterium]|nr:FAD:protein FMN transferase [Bacteroidetes Order II. bacterium]